MPVTTTELVYFNVTGHFYDVEAPDTSGSISTPRLEWISAFIDFIPRLPHGFSALINDLDLGDLGSSAIVDTAVAISSITGRIIEGQLATVNADDTAGVQLLANSAPIQSALTAHGVSDLIYDVRFRSVTYALLPQSLKPFAFTAPQDNSTICITDPDLTRLDYAGP